MSGIVDRIHELYALSDFPGSLPSSFPPNPFQIFSYPLQTIRFHRYPPVAMLLRSFYNTYKAVKHQETFLTKEIRSCADQMHISKVKN